MQSNLDDVIRYYLQYLEKRLYTVSLIEKKLFDQKRRFLHKKGVFLIEDVEKKRLLDGEK